MAFFLSLMVIAFSELGSAAPCFSGHIQEAIQLNSRRNSLYSQVTGGRSQSITRELIGAEIIAYPLAKFIERKANYFWKNAVYVACEEFVPIHRVPKFTLTPESERPNEKDFLELDIKLLKQELAEVWQREGEEALLRKLEESLEPLNKTPQINCLVRHVLESTRYVIVKGQELEKVALAKGLVRNPKSITRMLIKHHLQSLPFSHRLDRKALALQVEGIPIICQDVPPIP